MTTKQQRAKLAKQKTLKEVHLRKAIHAMSVKYGLFEILQALEDVSSSKDFDEMDRRFFKDQFKEIAESKGNYVIQCGCTLPELYKIEAFEQELRDNPYQLKLIA